uniref:U1-type domain-containing protein n=1 Tax=Meleagris gallopavo TaxID=9103 RepID=A0A803YES9_MELGA
MLQLSKHLSNWLHITRSFEYEKVLATDSTEEKKEREKKQTNFTLCNVCNIQLNSAAQAQIHYNGKSHQKRLKQLSSGNLKSDNGVEPGSLSGDSSSVESFLRI